MISKDLEDELGTEEAAVELKAFANRLRSRREPLENALVERTRLEVEEARFANRVALAKTITNKLRRTTHAKLLELAGTRSRSEEWCSRFFHTRNGALEALDRDGARSMLPRTSLPAEALEAEADLG